MDKLLEANVMTIKSAPVTVQALMIAGKQMTLAVFRQLPERSLLQPSLALNGVPWGHVNYHEKRCSKGDYGKHLHIIWQEGNSLYLDIVSRHGNYEKSELELRAKVWKELVKLPQLFIAV